jgi:hypothetical protein
LPDHLTHVHCFANPFAYASMQSKDVFFAGQDIVKPEFCAGFEGDKEGIPNPVLTADGTVVAAEVVVLVVEVGLVVVGIVEPIVVELD